MSPRKSEPFIVHKDAPSRKPSLQFNPLQPMVPHEAINCSKDSNLHIGEGPSCMTKCEVVATEFHHSQGTTLSEKDKSSRTIRLIVLLVEGGAWKRILNPIALQFQLKLARKQKVPASIVHVHYPIGSCCIPF